MADDDLSKVQTFPGGPLTPEFRQRILAMKAKHSMNFGDIATQVGIAGSTLGNITRTDYKISLSLAQLLKNAIEEGEKRPVGSWRGAAQGYVELPSASISTSKIDVAAVKGESGAKRPPENHSFLQALETLRRFGFSVQLTYNGPDPEPAP